MAGTFRQNASSHPIEDFKYLHDAEEIQKTQNVMERPITIQQL
jgi:hypothetical protein